MDIYTVVAYRYGDREKHSYIVGVFSTEDQAIQEADIEEAYRGGKYFCEILRIPVDSTIAGGERHDWRTWKIIKALPPFDLATWYHNFKKRVNRNNVDIGREI